ncbi:hypothetical protein Leryth_026170, partial [Lithospermum erythrorhizon]
MRNHIVLAGSFYIESDFNDYTGQMHENRELYHLVPGVNGVERRRS